MKILIAYYSRTKNTERIALAIKENFIKAVSDSIKANKIALMPQCDIEAILDTKNRIGIIGYLFAGRDAVKKKLTKLKPLKFNPTDYDLVIIGTPIWAYNVSVPVKTYLMQNSGKFKNVAFFCTQGGKGAEKAFEEMENDCGNKPIATVKFLTKDVARNNFKNDLEKFISEISNFVCDGTKL
ncbi:MAG: hypothetical protein UV36_C0006G0007 [Parcubacteria group bacterium GW2011_GWC2_42_6]|nr:MAG: hypothetical protein UV36_C0006G0007 [Parcubacteria group bacterium GW2011_GWC2_42_6]